MSKLTLFKVRLNLCYLNFPCDDARYVLNAVSIHTLIFELRGSWVNNYTVTRNLSLWTQANFEKTIREHQVQTARTFKTKTGQLVLFYRTLRNQTALKLIKNVSSLA